MRNVVVHKLTNSWAHGNNAGPETLVEVRNSLIRHLSQEKIRNEHLKYHQTKASWESTDHANKKNTILNKSNKSAKVLTANYECIEQVTNYVNVPISQTQE